MINKKRLIRLAQELIRIDSQNPPGQEGVIAHFISRILKELGLAVRFYEFAKGRTNLVAKLKAKKPKFSLLLSPHLDTVPVGSGWRFPPLAAKIFQGRLYGRGATDCKGNLASAIEAINSLIEDKVKLDYDLIFAATADEESGSLYGIIPLLEKNILRADYALILDADDFEIILAQKGLLHFKVCVAGKKAHGAYPWRGKNAIEISSRIIQALKKHKFVYPRHSLLHPPTINIGTIRGGDKVNMVADWCEFEVDARFLPGMQKENFLKEIKRIIAKVTKKFKIFIQGEQLPYTIDKNHPLVEALKKASKEVLGKFYLSASEGATVITFFQKKNIPAVAFGCGKSGCAHATDEYVKINDLYQSAKILEKFLKGFSGEKDAEKF